MQVGWLIRRLSRIYPGEIPYRISGVARAFLQERGWFDAMRPPSPSTDARYGVPWVHVPDAQFVDTDQIQKTVDRTHTKGVRIFDIDVPLVTGIPDWNRDPKTNSNIGQSFGLSIDFRHIAGGVDIKYLWELNRHIWLVPIAQAYAVAGDRGLLKLLRSLLNSWLDNCPYPLGANWSSPVEHGIRLINWSIVWHLIGGQNSVLFADAEGKTLLARWLDSIYQHMRFASDNYSFYSSSDNHLIGEAAGIFVAAHTWDLWGESRAMRTRAKSILEAEILKQFSPDGVNLEQAICYHKFSLEFLLAARLCGMANGDDFSPAFQSRMCKAIEFLAAMMDCNGKPPAIGDSDDGKVFSFVGDGAASAYMAVLRMGATLFPESAVPKKLMLLGDVHHAESQWLVVPSCAVHKSTANVVGAPLESRFEKGGYVIVGNDLHTAVEFRITIDVGPLGYNRIAGHGHADALQVLLSVKGRDFLVDPGTYCYNAAPHLRHYFRGTGAHNTVEIDGADQSIYGGSFLWLRDYETKVNEFTEDGQNIIVVASHDGYQRLDDPLRHFRKVSFDLIRLELIVEDYFECAKSHHFKLNWHLHPNCVVSAVHGVWTATRDIGAFSMRIDPPIFEVTVTSGEEVPPSGWFSPHFYERQPTPRLVAAGVINPSSVIRTTFSFNAVTT